MKVRTSKLLTLIWLGLFASFIIVFGSHCSDTFVQGQRIYMSKCANCHGDEGQGLASMYPPLTKSKVITDSLFLIPCIIKNGLNGPRKVNGVIFNKPMDKITGLNDTEINNLINFLNSEFGKSPTSIYPKVINDWINSCN